MNNFLMQSLSWLLRWNQLSVLFMLLFVVVSATGVSLAAHQTRQQYTELQEIRYLSDRLDSDYEKLLLEQSAWADFSRVDLISRNELNMKAPGYKDMLIVKR